MSLLVRLSSFSTAYIQFIAPRKWEQLLKNTQKPGIQELRWKGWHTSYFLLLVMLFPNYLVYSIPSLSQEEQMWAWGLHTHKATLQNLSFKSSFRYNNTDVPMIPDTMGLYLYCYSQDPITWTAYKHKFNKIVIKVYNEEIKSFVLLLSAF